MFFNLTKSLLGKDSFVNACDNSVPILYKPVN